MFSITNTFLILLTLTSVKCTINDVTSDVLKTHTKGVIAAFGDFNADKISDVFVIRDHGKTLSLLLAADENTFSPELQKSFNELVLLNLTKSSRLDRITNIVPADYDGDTQMDVLFMWQPEGAKTTTVEIYYGKDHEHLNSDPFVIPESFLDQPLVFDYNGDLIPDILGPTEDKEPYLHVYQARPDDRNFTLLNFSSPVSNFRSEYSGFVDLNNDLNADLCLGTSDDLEFFYNHNGYFTKGRTVSFPKLEHIGKPSFVDFDKNGEMDVLLPGCKFRDCNESSIYLCNNLQSPSPQWIQMPIDLTHGDTHWRFHLPSSVPGWIGEIPMTLRMGDFNFDGYPDMLTVLADSKGSQLRASLILNKKCQKDCGEHFQTLSVDWSVSLHSANEKAVAVAFYDYLENGILDVILSTYKAETDYSIRIWKQEFTEDASFMKVMVTSGVCFDSCPYGRKPYGINQPGPVVHYKMKDTDGNPHEGIASQITQSSYLSLQLPYVVFGLGHTPNFIDDITVGISQTRGMTSYRTKTWTSVIPNSQLIIIPYPQNKPSKWINKLFVTPSRLVLLTGISLLGTCLFLAIITGILHWNERREDKKEKLQEAHKFHFDAM